MVILLIGASSIARAETDYVEAFKRFIETPPRILEITFSDKLGALPRQHFLVRYQPNAATLRQSGEERFFTDFAVPPRLAWGCYERDCWEMCEDRLVQWHNARAEADANSFGASAVQSKLDGESYVLTLGLPAPFGKVTWQGNEAVWTHRDCRFNVLLHTNYGRVTGAHLLQSPLKHTKGQRSVTRIIQYHYDLPTTPPGIPSNWEVLLLQGGPGVVEYESTIRKLHCPDGLFGRPMFAPGDYINAGTVRHLQVRTNNVLYEKSPAGWLRVPETTPFAVAHRPIIRRVYWLLAASFLVGSAALIFMARLRARRERERST
jgi:hypothetical protein